jgi:hypothetical protein
MAPVRPAVIRCHHPEPQQSRWRSGVAGLVPRLMRIAMLPFGMKSNGMRTRSAAPRGCHSPRGPRFRKDPYRLLRGLIGSSQNRTFVRWSHRHRRRRHTVVAMARNGTKPSFAGQVPNVGFRLKRTREALRTSIGERQGLGRLLPVRFWAPGHEKQTFAQLAVRACKTQSGTLASGNWLSSQSA